MLNLRSLFWLPGFVSFSLIAHAYAAPDGSIGLDQKGSGPELAATLTGGEGCQDSQLQLIREGFLEMNQLFQAALNPDWDGDIERDFFGKRERIQNYTQMIESNLLRASQYSNLKGSGIHNPDIHIRCDDPNKYCDEGRKKKGEHVAYNIGNEPHVNFCQPYFPLEPLEKTVDDIAKNAGDNMQLMRYYNRATAWARQVMHFSVVGTAIVEKMDPNWQINSSSWTAITTMYTAPMNTSFLAGVQNERQKNDGPFNVETLKYAYGATRAKLLARFSTQEPYDAANNAESYALYAQARYVMAKKNFYPNMPVIEYENEARALADNDLQDGERKNSRYACFDATDVVPRNKKTNSLGAPIASSAPINLPMALCSWSLQIVACFILWSSCFSSILP